MNTTETYTTEQSWKDALQLFMKCLLSLSAIAIGSSVYALKHVIVANPKFIIGPITVLALLLLYVIIIAFKSYDGSLAALIGGLCLCSVVGYVTMSALYPVAATSMSESPIEAMEVADTGSLVSIDTDNTGLTTVTYISDTTGVETRITSRNKKIVQDTTAFVEVEDKSLDPTVTIHVVDLTR